MAQHRNNFARLRKNNDTSWNSAYLNNRGSLFFIAFGILCIICFYVQSSNLSAIGFSQSAAAASNWKEQINVPVVSSEHIPYGASAVTASKWRLWMDMTPSEQAAPNSNSNEDNNMHTTITSAVEDEEEARIIRPKYCSSAQLDKIYSTFKTPLYQSDTNKRFHTPIMKRTHCPNEEWARAYFQNKYKKDGYNNRKKQFLGINVGCNKGLDAIEMARLLSRDTNISVNEWNNALTFATKSKSRPICGVPHDMSFPSGQPASSALTDNKKNNNNKAYGHIHCIEPMPSTVEILKDTLKKLGTGYEDSIIVTKAAMSNYTGTTLFPNSIDSAGAEGKSLKHCEGLTEEEIASSSCVKVPVYSLDNFMREQEEQQHGGGSSNSNNNNKNSSNDVHPNNNNIDMLLIDAEGYDYEVLQGARETLKRVTYLLFEVHIVGNWMNHSLSKTIDTILSDFTCYWAGNNQLWRITNCMNKDLEELYEYKSWSNIACVHQRETELVDIMENVFRRTINNVE